MRGAIAAGHEITAQAGARALAEGGNPVECLRRRRVRLVGRREPANGPGRRWVHARPPCHRRLQQTPGLLRRCSRPGLERTSTAAMDAVDIPFERVAAPLSPALSRRACPRARCPAPSPGSPRLIAPTARCRGANCSRRQSTWRGPGRRAGGGRGACTRYSTRYSGTPLKQGRLRRPEAARGR